MAIITAAAENIKVFTSKHRIKGKFTCTGTEKMGDKRKIITADSNPHGAYKFSPDLDTNNYFRADGNTDPNPGAY